MLDKARTMSEKWNNQVRWVCFFLTGFIVLTSASGSFAQMDSLLNVLQALPRDTNRVNALNELAYANWNIDPQRGIGYGDEALRLADSLQYDRGKAVAHKVIGVCYWSMGSYDPALRAFFDGLKIAEKIGDRENINRIEHNMALVHEDMGNTDQAIYFFRKNVEWYLRSGQLEELPRVYNNLGTAFFQQRKIDSSLANYQKALTVSPQKDNIDEAKFIFINMSEVLFYQKQYEKAREYLDKAIAIYTRENDKSGLVECYTMAGNLYVTQGKLPEARVNFSKALALAREGNFNHFFSGLYRSMSRLDSAQGNYRDAFLHFRKAAQLQDSLTNFRQKSEYERLLIQYRADQKEKENELLRQANLISTIKMEDNQRLMLIVVIGSISILGLIIYFSQKRAEYLKKMEEAEMQHQLRSEKERIAQDLHDNIGTQLTSLSLGLHKFARERGLEPQGWGHLNQSVQDTMLELRDTIWAIHNEEITLDQLGDKINNLFWRLRQSSDTHYTLHLPVAIGDQKLKPTQAINLFRIVQEAINNSVSHGGATTVNVNIDVIPVGQLSVVVSDNGCGFEVEQKKKEGHFGLTNMHKRAAEINGELTVNSVSGQGTTISLRVALACG